jgi:outer membrane biosynthesis protein TonB
LMARPGQTESESVPIWLKLSEADAEQMDQVLARPEFAGWTKAEWCLEIIQTALRYYAKRPIAEPGRARAASQPATAEPSPPAPEPEPATPEPRQAAPKRKSVPPKPKRAAPKRKPAAPAPEVAELEPEGVAPGPEIVAPEPETVFPESLPQPECPHPADARDYQTGTCAACGAILWD